MADDSSNSSPFFSWQVLILIAGALGLFLRPSADVPTHATNVGQSPATMPKKVDAELWEDPYNCFYLGAPGQGPSGAGPDAGTISAPVELPATYPTVLKDVCILPVIVRGSLRLPEAKEMRIRFRTAVVSGLGVDGFVPDDTSHLMRLTLPFGLMGTQPVTAEWYLRGNLPRNVEPKYSAVLVVWVPDNALDLNPMEALASARDALLAQIRGILNGSPFRSDFAVIGPYWSGTLRDMLREPQAHGANMKFYSASATMADGLLDRFVDTADKDAARGRDRFAAANGNDPAAGPVLVNLTTTDEQLADALIRELYLRGVDLTDPDTRIALISDWDTDYGRAIPFTFAAKVQQWLASGAKPKPDAKALERLSAEKYKALEFDDIKTWPKQIARAYYLSGVAGNLTPSGKSTDDSKQGSDADPSVATHQRAEGEQQVDYISRLGGGLQLRFHERDRPERIKDLQMSAIGIFGSDVYDKLLLIQTLRPQYKDAIFFTDSLDARLLDTVQAAPVTRNLVVVTPFGLELSLKYQRGVSPFRGSDETAAFLAVITAAGVMKDGELASLQAQLEPLRYEVGRTGAISLLVPGGYVPPTGTPRLHPGVRRPLPFEKGFLAAFGSTYLYGAIASIALVATAVAVFSGKWRPHRGHRSDRWINLMLVLGAIMVVVAVAVFLDYDGVEPFSWVDGASLWPSELLRLATVAWCVGSFVYCHKKIAEGHRSLATEFDLSMPSGHWNLASMKLKRLYEMISRPDQAEAEYLVPIAGPEPAEGSLPTKTVTPWNSDPLLEKKMISASAVWKAYCVRATPVGRFARSATMSFLYFSALAALVGSAGRPFIPYRGSFSHLWDSIATLGADVSLVYLIFWVVDETHLCFRTVRKLGSRLPTSWPRRAYDDIPAFAPGSSNAVEVPLVASPYLDVVFIGKLTAVTVPLIVLPFIGLTLYIAARWHFFADWHAQAVVVAFLGTGAAMCVLCALMLRNAAVEAKSRAIDTITLSIAGAHARDDGVAATALKDLKKMMEADSEGAFLPWHQQPFVSALLIPFSSTGGLGIIEYFLQKP